MGDAAPRRPPGGKDGQVSRWRGGAYVWRTRKPHAVIGLPLIGRHTGYVGQTNNFGRRRGEHLYGSTRYTNVVQPKDWSDLSPKVWTIPLPNWRWLRLMVEQLLIWVLCPVYNVKGQGSWNIRRVRPATARQQRWRRDRFGVTASIGAMVVRLLVWAMLAVAAWAVWTWTS